MTKSQLESSLELKQKAEFGKRKLSLDWWRNFLLFLILLVLVYGLRVFPA